MEERIISGWLFDLYPAPGGITLWLADAGGARHRCSVPFAPWFFMHVREQEAERVAAAVRSLPVSVTLSWDRQREIYRDEEWNVLRVTVHDPRALRNVVGRLERHFPHFVFFNSDIPAQQLFLYATGLFPLARGELHHR